MNLVNVSLTETKESRLMGIPAERQGVSDTPEYSKDGFFTSVIPGHRSNRPNLAVVAKSRLEGTWLVGLDRSGVRRNPTRAQRGSYTSATEMSDRERDSRPDTGLLVGVMAVVVDDWTILTI
jgi:hypothetical protein